MKNQMQSPHFKKHMTTTADDPVPHFDKTIPINPAQRQSDIRRLEVVCIELFFPLISNVCKCEAPNDSYSLTTIFPTFFP
jgi:hypothetical protein